MAISKEQIDEAKRIPNCEIESRQIYDKERSVDAAIIPLRVAFAAGWNAASERVLALQSETLLEAAPDESDLANPHTTGRCPP